MGADGGAELSALDSAGLPSVGENEKGTELALALLMLEPAGLPLLGEDGTAAELELMADSLAGATGVEAELLMLELAGLPSVGEAGTAAELLLPTLEPAGLPSVGEDGPEIELELTLDSPAGAIGVEAELGLLLPAPVEYPAGEDEPDAGPDAGRLEVVAPDGVTEEEAAGPEAEGVAPKETGEE